MSRRKKSEITERVQTMRAHVEAEAGELEKAVARHVEVSSASYAASMDVRREVRRRSLPPTTPIPKQRG